MLGRSNAILPKLALILLFTWAPASVLAITINGESRLTESQYAAKHGRTAADVKREFSATGTILCERLRATAQLTGRNDIITTAAHVFDDNTCQRYAPTQCTFTTNDGSRSVSKRVSAAVKIGPIACPTGKDGKDGPNDWAVLKLESPIAGVTPYQIPEDGIVDITHDVLSVSAGSIDFFLNHVSHNKTKTIDECRIRRDWRRNNVAVLLSFDCDFANGNSGGSILHPLREVSHRLLGIATAADRESLHAPPIDGEYKENKWASYGVPLTGEFLATLKKAMEEGR